MLVMKSRHVAVYIARALYKAESSYLVTQRTTCRCTVVPLPVGTIHLACVHLGHQAWSYSETNASTSPLKRDFNTRGPTHSAIG
eukprot:2407947-Pyramimonas_sp.AAC.4